MHLTRYVDALRDQLVVAAETGGSESRGAVARLVPGLESATRLVLLEVLSAAADEITRELAPGSVEVRLRGSDPDFVVTLPPSDDGEARTSRSVDAPLVGVGDDEGSTSRLNLRLPETLKARIEEAARREGLSLNAWLVRAAAAAVEGGTQSSMPRRTPGGSQRFTGWVQ